MTYLDCLMAEVKRCQMNDCHRAASAFCYCCQKNTCTRHFNQHIDNLRAQIDPLADAVNSTVEKIDEMTLEQLTEAQFRKLDQWKCDMHQLINQIFLDKRKEIEDIVENSQENFFKHQIQQKDNVVKIQQEVKQLVEDGDATIQQIESLKKQLAKIEKNQTEFEIQFLSIYTQVFDPQFVTVSSLLNNLNTSFAAFALLSSCKVFVLMLFTQIGHFIYSS